MGAKFQFGRGAGSNRTTHRSRSHSSISLSLAGLRGLFDSLLIVGTFNVFADYQATVRSYRINVIVWP